MGITHSSSRVNSPRPLPSMPIPVFLTRRAAPGRARRRSGARARWPGRRRSRSRTAPRQLPRIRMVGHPSNNFERTLKKFKLVRSCLGYVETRPYYLAYCARTEKHELSEEDDAFQNYVILFHATTATDFEQIGRTGKALLQLEPASSRAAA